MKHRLLLLFLLLEATVSLLFPDLLLCSQEIGQDILFFAPPPTYRFLRTITSTSGISTSEISDDSPISDKEWRGYIDSCEEKAVDAIDSYNVASGQPTVYYYGEPVIHIRNEPVLPTLDSVCETGYCWLRDKWQEPSQTSYNELNNASEKPYSVFDNMSDFRNQEPCDLYKEASSYSILDNYRDNNLTLDNSVTLQKDKNGISENSVLDLKSFSDLDKSYTLPEDRYSSTDYCRKLVALVKNHPELLNKPAIRDRLLSVIALFAKDSDLNQEALSLYKQNVIKTVSQYRDIRNLLIHIPAYLHEMPEVKAQINKLLNNMCFTHPLFTNDITATDFGKYFFNMPEVQHHIGQFNRFYKHLDFYPDKVSLGNSEKFAGIRFNFINQMADIFLIKDQLTELQLGVIRALATLEQLCLKYSSDQALELVNLLHDDTVKKLLLQQSQVSVTSIGEYLKEAKASAALLEYLASPKFKISDKNIKHELIDLYAEHILLEVNNYRYIDQFLAAIPEFLCKHPQIHARVKEVIKRIHIANAAFIFEGYHSIPAVKQRAQEIAQFNKSIGVNFDNLPEYHHGSKRARIQDQLIENLDGIFRFSSELDEEQTSAIKNLTQMSLKLLDANKPENAQDFVDCLEPSMVEEFFLGTGKELTDTGCDYIVSKASGKIISAGIKFAAKYGIKILARCAFPLQVGMALYGLYKDGTTIKQDITDICQALVSKNYRNIGAISVSSTSKSINESSFA